MFNESTIRSLVKALSWRIVATLTTTVLVFVFTRRIDVAVTVGGIEAIAKSFLYFGHERVWNALTLGREPVPTVNTPPGSLVSETITLANSDSKHRSIKMEESV